MHSDDRIVVTNKPGRYDHEFPYPDYPREFPRVAVRLEAISYGDRKLIAFCDNLGIFSHSDASRREIIRADRNRLAELDYPFSQIGSPLPLQQGVPFSRCPSPKCRRQRFPAPMRVFATVWNRPVPGDCFWGDNDFVQVVFEVCTGCGTICATNKCD